MSTNWRKYLQPATMCSKQKQMDVYQLKKILAVCHYVLKTEADGCLPTEEGICSLPLLAKNRGRWMSTDKEDATCLHLLRACPSYPVFLDPILHSLSTLTFLCLDELHAGGTVVKVQLGKRVCTSIIPFVQQYLLIQSTKHNSFCFFFFSFFSCLVFVLRIVLGLYR